MRATSSRSRGGRPVERQLGDDVPGLVVAEHEERGRAVARQIPPDRGRLDTGREVGGTTPSMVAAGHGDP